MQNLSPIEDPSEIHRKTAISKWHDATADVIRCHSTTSSGAHVQVHTDGGFVSDTLAAAAFVITVYRPAHGQSPSWIQELARHRGIHISSARSAFQCELLAFEAAIDFLVSLHTVVAQSTHQSAKKSGFDQSLE